MTKITPENIDALLDDGMLEVKMLSGKWWKLRRNGATKRWKTDPQRIRVGVKAGMCTYDCIATYAKDLGPRGGHLLDSPYIRVREVVGCKTQKELPLYQEKDQVRQRGR